MNVSLIKNLNLVVGWVERASSKTSVEKRHIKFSKKPEDTQKRVKPNAGTLTAKVLLGFAISLCIKASWQDVIFCINTGGFTAQPNLRELYSDF